MHKPIKAIAIFILSLPVFCNAQSGRFDLDGYVEFLRQFYAVTLLKSKSPNDLDLNEKIASLRIEAVKWGDAAIAAHDGGDILATFLLTVGSAGLGSESAVQFDREKNYKSLLEKKYIYLLSVENLQRQDEQGLSVSGYKNSSGKCDHKNGILENAKILIEYGDYPSFYTISDLYFNLAKEAYKVHDTICILYFSDEAIKWAIVSMNTNTLFNAHFPVRVNFSRDERREKYFSLLKDLSKIDPILSRPEKIDVLTSEANRYKASVEAKQRTMLKEDPRTKYFLVSIP